MKSILTALTLFVALSSAVSAGLINSKAEWNKMPNNAKSGYVMAIYDMWFQDNFYDPDYIRKSKDNQLTCLWSLGLNTNNFIAWIDRGYLNPRNRDLAPHNVFFQELDKVCD